MKAYSNPKLTSSDFAENVLRSVARQHRRSEEIRFLIKGGIKAVLMIAAVGAIAIAWATLGN